MYCTLKISHIRRIVIDCQLSKSIAGARTWASIHTIKKTMADKWLSVAQRNAKTLLHPRPKILCNTLVIKSLERVAWSGRRSWDPSLSTSKMNYRNTSAPPFSLKYEITGTNLLFLGYTLPISDISLFSRDWTLIELEENSSSGPITGCNRSWQFRWIWSR